MFDNINVTYNKQTDQYKITGFFGMYFRRKLLSVLTEKKLNALFIDRSATSIVFYGFFALEVQTVLNILISKGSVYGVKKSTINKIINYIDTKILVNDENKFKLNYDNIKHKLNWKILKHQENTFDTYEQIKSYLHYRGLLINAATGTGKTFIGLGLAEVLNSNKIIIVADLKTFDEVWIKSITETIYKTPQPYYLVNSGNEYNDERIILVNFEALSKLNDISKLVRGLDTTILVDESHNFADITSKQTNELIKLVDNTNSDNVILLSGTPVIAYSKELAVIFKLIDKRFTGVIEKRFMALYKSPNNLLKEILRKRFTDYSVKIEKDEIKLEPVKTLNVPIKLKNGDKYTLKNIKEVVKKFIIDRRDELERDFHLYEKAYNDLYQKAKSKLMSDGVEINVFITYEKEFQDVIKYYNNGQLMFNTETLKSVNKFEKEILLPVMTSEEKTIFKEAKTIVKYLDLKLQGEALSKVVMRYRIDCHADMAKVFNYENIIESTSKKTLIFSNYIDVCQASIDKLKNIGYTPLNVYGKETRDIGGIIKSFANDKNLNPLVATFKSLSTGNPMVMANVVIVLDLPFRMYVYEQAISRSWRLGQDDKVWVYIPTLDTDNEPNINTRNVDIIEYFKKEVEELTGHKTKLEIDKDLTVSLEEAGVTFDNDVDYNTSCSTTLSTLLSW
jgi:superfamily II DNA or RNA helicase